MIVNEERKTTVAQRIVIVVIAVLLLGCTFAIYAGLVLSYSNQEEKATIDSEKQNRWSELYSEYLGKVDEQGKKLSAKYFDTFKKYRSNVKAYNAADVNELKTNDLVKGSGEKITYEYGEDGKVSNYNTNYAAYYIGWLSDETIFDSSFDNNDSPTSLKSPLNGSTSMIQGWIEGIEGMRIGGVREITIPSIMGYGDTEQGAIPANSPLKFIVMLVEKPEAVEVSDELEKLTKEVYGTSLRSQQ